MLGSIRYPAPEKKKRKRMRLPSPDAGQQPPASERKEEKKKEGPPLWGADKESPRCFMPARTSADLRGMHWEAPHGPHGFMVI